MCLSVCVSVCLSVCVCVPVFCARFFLVVVELTQTGRSLLHMWQLQLDALPVTMGTHQHSYPSPVTMGTHQHSYPSPVTMVSDAVRKL